METAEVLRSIAAAMRDESRVVLDPANIFETAAGQPTFADEACRACVHGHLRLLLKNDNEAVEDIYDVPRFAVVVDDFTEERITAAQSADALDELADSLVTA